MGRKTVELRAIMDVDGTEIVQTGIYVFEDTTIAMIWDLMSNGIEVFGKRYPVKMIEFDQNDEEEDE